MLEDIKTVELARSELTSRFSSGLEKAGHPIVHLDLQCRQPELVFTPLNQLHYDMQVVTSPVLNKNLAESLTVVGEIAGRNAREIAEQGNAQRRMLWVEVASPTMRAVDSSIRANPGFAAYVDSLHMLLLLCCPSCIDGSVAG